MVAPLIVPATASGLTVKDTVAGVPQPVLYVMVTKPAVTGVITPVPLMMAVPKSLLLQVPMVTASERVSTLPIQTLAIPIIADGVVNTFTTAPTVTLPQVPL